MGPTAPPVFFLLLSELNQIWHENCKAIFTSTVGCPLCYLALCVNSLWLLRTYFLAKKKNTGGYKYGYYSLGSNSLALSCRLPLARSVSSLVLALSPMSLLLTLSLSVSPALSLSSLVHALPRSSLHPHTQVASSLIH